MAKRRLGIDIGANTLKVVLLEENKIMASSIQVLPDHLVKDGNITSLEVLSELIRSICQEMDVKNLDTSIVLSESLSFVRNITMPFMNEEQLIYNIPFEFKDYINDELSDYVFDYAMISDEKEILERQALENNELSNTMDVLVAACSKKIIEDMTYLCKKCNLKLKRIIPYAFSYIQLIRQLKDNHKEYCFIDIGYDSMKLSIYSSDEFKASRRIDVGLKNVDDIISQNKNVDIHIAHTYGMNNFENCLSDDDVMNFFRSMAIEISRALNFYRFNYRDSRLDDVYICGGGSKILPLIQIFKSTLNEYTIHLADELMQAPGMGILLPAYSCALEG